MNSVEILAKAAERDKLNHAYLAPVYPGTELRGYGAELAREILCGPSADGCRDRVMRNAHPDYYWFTVLNDKNKISIDQVETLISRSAHAPMKSDRKVYVISRAEDFSPEAANSVLKVLEEPPGFLYLVLLTEDPNRLLPTILSRCQVLPTGGMTSEGLYGLLTSRGFSEDEADYLLAAANYRGDLADELLEGEAGDPLAHAERYREEYSALDLVQLAEAYADAGDLVEKDVLGDLFYVRLQDSGVSDIVEAAKKLKDLSEDDLDYLLTSGLYGWRGKARKLIEEQGGIAGDGRFPEYLRRGKVLDGALKELGTNANVQLLLETTFLKLETPRSSLVDVEGD